MKRSGTNVKTPIFWKIYQSLTTVIIRILCSNSEFWNNQNRAYARSIEGKLIETKHIPNIINDINFDPRFHYIFRYRLTDEFSSP